MKTPLRAVTQTVEVLLRADARSVTKVLDPKLVVRATRRLYKGKIRKSKFDPIEVSLHIGRPNYLERAFIKDCKRAGEPFPVRKPQITMPPKRRS